MRSGLSRRGALSGLLATALPAAASPGRSGRNDSFSVERPEIFIKGLAPEHDGLVVAQLSDLHIGRGVPDGRIIGAVRAVNEQKPDVVVLTGDFVTTRFDPFDRVPQLLEPLRAPAFAVLGNHDHISGPDEITRRLEGIGISVLQNQHTTQKLKGADFTVFGIDDSTTHHDDADAAFKGAPAQGSRLVLTHTPTGARKLPAWGNLLCLSGHTHGGQINIPRLTEGIFKRVGHPYIAGLYQVRGNQLYVNRGLGFGRGTLLPRLASEPEVTFFTLRAAAPV